MSHSNTSNINTLKIANPIIFNLSEDLEATRNFYTNILGLEEKSYEKTSSLEYNLNTSTLIFYKSSNVKIASFKKKEELEESFLSIKVSEIEFFKITNNLNKHKKEVKSTWNHDGIYSITLIDPSNNKLFIYFESSVKKVGA